MPTHLHIFSLLGALLMTALTSLLPPLLEALSPAPRRQVSRMLPAEVTIARTKPQAELPASQPEMKPLRESAPQTHMMPQLNSVATASRRSGEGVLHEIAEVPEMPDYQLSAIPMATSLVPDLTLPGVQANLQADASSAASISEGSHSPQRRDAVATGAASISEGSPSPQRRDAVATALPRPIRQTRPVYPYAAKIRGIEGRVLVEFTVFPDGHCGEAQVLSAIPAGYFEKAALDAVEQWRFAPAVKDGSSVPARMKIQIAFDLQNP